MDRQEKLYNDILNSIILIEEFTVETNSFDEYINDFKTKSAVERQLSIIGEALSILRKNNLSELNFAYEIIGMRNRIIHAYDTIDDSIIWSIIQIHLAPLKDDVTNKLINGFDQDKSPDTDED